LNQASWIGNSNYNALQTVFTRKLSHGLQFGAAYTYSKTLTDVTGVGTFPLGGGAYNDQLNPSGGYGPAAFCPLHRFVTTYLCNLPSFHNNQGLAGKALSGCSPSGVVVLQTGPALTFIDNTAGTIYGLAQTGAIGASLCPGFTVKDILTPGGTE